MWRVALLLRLLLLVAGAGGARLAPMSAGDLRRADQLIDDAARVFARGNIDAGVDAFLRVIDRYPDVVEGYVSAGALLERIGERGRARQIYKDGFRRAPGTRVSRSTSDGVIADRLCTLLAEDKRRRRRGDPRNERRRQLHLDLRVARQRHVSADDVRAALSALQDDDPDDALMRKACRQAAALQPGNPRPHLNLGLVYLLLDRYEAAVEPLERARHLLIGADDDDNDDVRTLLNDAYDFQAQVHSQRAATAQDALRYRRLQAQNWPMSTNRHLLAVALEHAGLDDEAAEAYRAAQAERVVEVNAHLPPRRRRALARSASETTANVKTVTWPASWRGPRPGDRTRVLPVDPLDGWPTEFVEKRVVVADLGTSKVTGVSGVISNAATVVFPSPMTNPGEYWEDPPDEAPSPRAVHRGTVVSALPAFADNWLDWVSNGLPRVLLARSFYPRATLLLPDNDFGYDVAAELNLNDDQVIYYKHNQTVHEFDRLLRMDWVGDGAEQGEDLLRPPAMALGRVRRALLKKVAANAGGDKERLPPAANVVYTSRPGSGLLVRSVINEDALIAAIRGVVGDKCLYVSPFKPPHHRNESVYERARQFANADLVIGPHGDALANVLFARPRPSLLYFPIEKPHGLDHGLANLVAAVNGSVYVASEMTAFVRGEYQATLPTIRNVVETLERIVRDRNWTRGNTCRLRDPRRTPDEALSTGRPEGDAHDDL